MQNLIHINLERLMLACSLFSYIKDKKICFNQDLITALKNLNTLKIAFKENLLECSFTNAS